MKAFANILALLLFNIQISCSQSIILHKDIDVNNIGSPKNNGYVLIFEQYFKDSVKICYNKKVLFFDFVETKKRLQASEKYCTIEHLYEKEEIFVYINGHSFRFTPLKSYRYYYLTFVAGKLGVTYSNLLRDYY